MKEQNLLVQTFKSVPYNNIWDIDEYILLMNTFQFINMEWNL